MNSAINVVLVSPMIAGNTGSIGRTCVALGASLILIHPLGFSLDEKKVRRAGLDYWRHVSLRQYESFDHFLNSEKPEHIFLFSKSATTLYYDAPYTNPCYLVFGSETTGLPPHLYLQHPSYSLPQHSPHIRSLNLANCATTAMYECYRHLYHK